MAEVITKHDPETNDRATQPLRGVTPDPATSPLDLSILIVTWNSERWIDRCLTSIPAATGDRSYEIIVHDNASSDGTLRRVPLDRVQVISSPQNDGFAAGSNRAFAVSRGRYLLLLNPDCQLDPGAVSVLCEFLDSHPEAAAAVPLLVDERGGSQREFQLRRLPTLRALAAEALLIDKLLPRNRTTRAYRYRDLDLSEPRQIEQPAAAALLIRRSVFGRIGALDETFVPAWFEDVDYCRRLANAGEKIFVVPAAGARHFGGASLEHLEYGRFIDIWYRNMWLYARKWFSAGEAEALRWSIIVGMMLRSCAALLGMKNGSSSRREAMRTYSSVMKKAMNRWGTHP